MGQVGWCSHFTLMSGCMISFCFKWPFHVDPNQYFALQLSTFCLGRGSQPPPDATQSEPKNRRSNLCLSCIILARSPRHFSICIFGRDAFDGVSLVQAAPPLPPVYSHSMTILCYHEPFRCCPLLRAVRAMLKQESSSATKMSNESYSHHW